MEVVSSTDFNSLYRQLHKHFELNSGIRGMAVRGHRLRECAYPTAWRVSGSPWLLLKGRRLNPFFAAAEIFWILSGNGDVEWISRFNKNMRNFSDPGEKDFNAPYGKRMFRYEVGWLNETPRRAGTWGEIRVYDQVIRAVEKLKTDPTTRQAVISIFHPHYDYLDSKDVACNTTVYLSLRDGELNTSVMQRSNDLVWGTPYNMLQFWHLGLLIAGMLGVERGWHCHFVNNLHIYEDLYPELKEFFESPTCFLEPDENEFDQQDCFQTIDRESLTKLAGLLHPENEKNYFAPLSDLLPVISRELSGVPKYWRDLWLLCFSYLQHRFHDPTRSKTVLEELKRLAVRDLEELGVKPFLVWLVKDFWRLHDPS